MESRSEEVESPFWPGYLTGTMNRSTILLCLIFAFCACSAQAGVIVSSEMVGGVEQVDFVVGMTGDDAPDEGRIEEYRPLATGSLTGTSNTSASVISLAMATDAVWLEPVKSVNARVLRDRTLRISPAPGSLLRPV